MATYQLKFKIQESATTDVGALVYIGVFDTSGTQTDISSGVFVDLTTQLDLIKSYIDANFDIASFTTYTTTTSNGVIEIIFTCDISTDPLTNIAGFIFNINSASINVAYVYFNFTTSVTLVTCESCLDITKSACEASYNFKVGLTANTDYFVVLENSKGKEYSATITSDSIGAITIDATAPEFPEGMFIPESGIYTLRVFADDTKEVQELLTFGTTQYYCIQLSFIYSQTFTSDITGVYLLGSGGDSFSIIVDDNGSAISIA